MTRPVAARLLLLGVLGLTACTFGRNEEGMPRYDAGRWSPPPPDAGAGEPNDPFCVSPLPVGSCVEGESRLLAVAAMSFPRLEERTGEPDRVSGFDLDCRVSDDGDYEGCYQPDAVTPDGTVEGVDAQAAALAEGVLESIFGRSFDEVFRDGLAAGEPMLLLEVTRPASAEAVCVGAVLYEGQPPEGEAAPQTDSSGRLIAGQPVRIVDGTAQRFERTDVVGGVVRAETAELSVPLPWPDAIDGTGTQVARLPLQNARLGWDPSRGQALLAGSASIGELVRVLALVDDELSSAAIFDALESIADLALFSGTGRCEALSFTLVLSLEPVELAP